MFQRLIMVHTLLGSPSQCRDVVDIQSPALIRGRDLRRQDAEEVCREGRGMRACEVDLEGEGLWAARGASTPDCSAGDCCDGGLWKEGWGIAVELVNCDGGGGRGRWTTG